MLSRITNRIVPCILLAAAFYLHFSYCEWDIRGRNEQVPSEQHQRAIYFSYRPSGQLFLLSKSLEDKEDAQLYGLVFPVVFAVFAIGVLRFTNVEEQDHRSAAWQNGPGG
jgi:hypothetical protein